MRSKVSLSVEKAGLFSIIVDNKRDGKQAFGVPEGGPMDTKAAHIANWLVGKDIDSAIVEITISGPRIKVTGECQLAFSGTETEILINGVPNPMYETINAKNNDVIQIGKAKDGCRLYMAIGGEFELPLWMGGQGYMMSGGNQITPRSILKKGDRIDIILDNKNVSRQFYEKFASPKERSQAVRVMAGPDFNYFDKDFVSKFFNDSHTISVNSNRMGYRVKSDYQNENYFNSEIISSATLPGTIQVTDSNLAIILLADAQTTGGYPRLGNIISADLDVLAQYKPEDSIRFQLIELNQAQKLREEYREYLKLIAE